jgi:hypothetical protein
MLKQLLLPSLSRVAPGSTAILEVPVGPTYRKIMFRVTAASGLDEADIGRIEVLLDGKVKQTYKSLAQLIDMNAYYDRGGDAVSATLAQFAVHFDHAELTDGTQRRLPDIGTADVRTMAVQLEIASGAPASIAIEAYALIDPTPKPLGVFVAVNNIPYTASASGDNQIDKLLRGPWYSAIHFFKSDVDSVEITANQVKVVDAPKSVLEYFQEVADPVKRVPQTANCTHVDFVLDGDMLTNTLKTQGLSDFRCILNLGTSGNIDIVTETLDTLQGV